MIARVALVGAALLSPLLFPYPFALLLSFLAGLVLPPVPLITGLIADVLYFTPGVAAFPAATVAGLFMSVATFFIQRFLKARIISA